MAVLAEMTVTVVLRGQQTEPTDRTKEAFLNFFFFEKMTTFSRDSRLRLEASWCAFKKSIQGTLSGV